VKRPPVRLRRARPGDAAALAALYRARRRWLLAGGNRQWRDERFSAADLRLALRRTTVLVAADRGGIVGAVRLAGRDPVFWPDHPVADALYVSGLVVDRSMAGRGVSQMLLAAADAHARACRRAALRLDCAPLPALAALYRRLGFTLIDDSSLGGYRVLRFERPRPLSR
jgi:GNAT superfamily N-acetyltransferase